jgi:teichuronic acid biosynthesis glycosyltransferase TuaG
VFLSILIPAYNCEKYIGQAIESVLQQEVSLELIIINDCSKDNVDKVVEKYLSDERVKYIHNKKNLGVAKTRNKGVELAQGKYIAFLDSDDWWTKDKLKKQLDLMRDNNVVISSTARELMTAKGQSTGRIIEVPNVVSFKKLLYGNLINCSS